MLWRFAAAVSHNSARMIGRQQYASPEDYSLRTVGSILNEGQAGGLSFNGVSIENPDERFIEAIVLTPGHAHGHDPSRMVVHWGAFGHPMLDENLEIMDNGAVPFDWPATRRTILSSKVGWMRFGVVAVGRTLAEPGEACKNLSSDQLAVICANAGVPPAVYLLSQLSDSSPGPNIGFLWHPTIIQSDVALAGLQSAVALRTEQ